MHTAPSKLADIGTTIFTVMTQLADAHGAVNLSQGFPDFDPDPRLVERVCHFMRQGRNQYAPMQGVPELRNAISAKAHALYGRRYDPATEITVTSGATEALYSAITAVVHAGDEVIVLDPAYDSYVPAIRLNGAVAVAVKMRHPDYRIDWNAVADRMSEKTRMIVLNSPHNPTGSVLSGEDIQALKAVLRAHRCWILSDEVYEHIVFDGQRHESMARDPELAEKSFVISSFGKTYHTTGWKIGYCLAPEPLSTEFRRIHQFLTFSANTPVQLAYAAFMENAEPYRVLSGFYQQKRDRFLELIQGSRFRPLSCRGTYFQMLDYSEISDEPDVDFARRLTVQCGVAAIPPSVFYADREDNRVLRFCFAKRDDTLEQAAERLCRV